MKLLVALLAFCITFGAGCVEWKNPGQYISDKAKKEAARAINKYDKERLAELQERQLELEEEAQKLSEKKPLFSSENFIAVVKCVTVFFVAVTAWRKSREVEVLKKAKSAEDEE